MRLGILVLFWSLALTAKAGESVRITDVVNVGLFDTEDMSGKPIASLRTDTPLEVLEKKDGVWKVKTAGDTSGWVKSIYLTSKKSSKIQLIELEIKYRASQEQLKKTEDELAKLKDELAEAKKNQGSGVSVKDMEKLKVALKEAKDEIAAITQQKEDIKNGKITAEDAIALTEKVKTLQAELDKVSAENAELKANAPVNPVSETSPVAGTENRVPPSADMLALQQENATLHETLTKVKLLVAAQSPAQESSSGGISVVWVLIILTILLLGGFFAGIAWLDYQQRRRHGGFRVY